MKYPADRYKAKQYAQVGQWRREGVSAPYVDYTNMGGARVMIGDTGPQSNEKWWAHAEPPQGEGGGWEFIAAGDDYHRVAELAMKWMRQNPSWPRERAQSDKPFSVGGGLDLGL